MMGVCFECGGMFLPQTLDQMICKDCHQQEEADRFEDEPEVLWN